VDHASRFVFSGPGRWPLEQSIQWAVDHGFSRVDFNADGPPNYPGTFTPDRAQKVRALAAEHGVRLGIHTLSAVNMAEITPVMAAAADEYVRRNFDLARALGCGYVICHGGFHFTGDREARIAAGIERMKKAATWAEERELDIYFENHNWEPDHAEIHYVPHTVDEMRLYVDAVRSPRFKWAFTVGHAALVPDGFDGFLDAFGAERIGQVRLHDTHGKYEQHLLPGEGILDFRHVFRRLSAQGYTGPFTLDFGTPEQRITWRDTFATWLAEESV
jgi:sugar phosphate isomerase/epimerase